MPPRTLIPLDRIDPDVVIADIEAIRRANPHRFEMELLSHVCYENAADGEVAGVLDLPDQPFWARGHIPGRPLMPGVLMVEAAAQLCSWLVHESFIDAANEERFFGFGGIDAVKFRGIVVPSQRVLILGKSVEIRPRRAVFETQAIVDGRMVYQGRITGMWV